MKLFARLFAELDRSTATLAKVNALKRYFAAAAPHDAAWAVYFLAGGKPRQVVPSGVLWAAAAQRSAERLWVRPGERQKQGHEQGPRQQAAGAFTHLTERRRAGREAFTGKGLDPYGIRS